MLEETDAGVDTVISNNTKDIGNNIRIPFDGQGVFFELDMSDYPDSPSSSTVTAPLQ